MEEHPEVDLDLHRGSFGKENPAILARAQQKDFFQSCEIRSHNH
jgi:hypothetical protein